MLRRHTKNKDIGNESRGREKNKNKQTNKNNKTLTRHDWTRLKYDVKQNIHTKYSTREKKQIQQRKSKKTI